MARKDSEKPKEITQSYLVTSAKYDFNVYEKRILYRIVELIQAELKGQPIGKGVTIQPTLYGDRHITMPLSKFLKNDDDENYQRVKKAFKRLSALQMSYENDLKREYHYFTVVMGVKLKSGIVKFQIADTLYNNLLDFASGYSQYELSIAFDFRSQYTMRFYEMFSRCGRPSITYSLQKLREMFMLQSKYKNVFDFIKYVIDPAQKELKASKASYWFTYEKIKLGRAFRSIQFNVHYRPEFDRKIPQQTSIRWEVDKRFLGLLNESLGTEDKNWKPHRELLIKAQKADYNEIKKILRNAQKAKNPVGYTINAFKKME